MRDETLVRQLRSGIDPMLPRPFRVTQVIVETHDVSTLWFEPADGRPNIYFTPGQIGMVGLPGVGEVPISFSSDSDDQDRLAMTIRAVGAVTKALTSLRPGDVAGMRGPYGTSWPFSYAFGKRLVIIAGGLGLAPLRSVVLEAIRTYDHLIANTLVYGAREPDELLFREDLNRWVVDPAMSVLLTVDKAVETWSGNVGMVTTLIDSAVVDPVQTFVMMCGPDVMMRAVGNALEERGLPPDRIWLTMERNMKCGVGLCGHCQFGPYFVCRDGPVIAWSKVSALYEIREV